MKLSNCECPKCGGLPINTREVFTGDAELFRRTDSLVFGYTSAPQTDWRLDAYLSAPDSDGTKTMTCSDCDHAWRHATPMALQHLTAE